MWWYVAALAAKGVLSAGSDIKGAISKNNAMMTQLGKTLNQLNLNYAAQHDRTEQALFNSQLGADQSRSKIDLGAAASGTMGASVQDAVSTVNVAQDRQTVSILRTQDQADVQFEQSVNKAIDDTSANMDWQSYGDKLFGQLIGAASQAALMAGSKAAEGAASSGGAEKAGASAPSTSSTFNYDLWGNRGGGASTGQRSWSSYLGGN